MSYVYMKALEKKAEKYDKGIKILTLGKLPKIKREILHHYLQENDKILDIGMGTGTFAAACVQSGKNLKFTGIDKSEKMLEIARKNLKETNLSTDVEILKLSVVALETTFQTEKFDKVTAILSFSELYTAERQFCLEQIHRLLKPNGQLIVVDETRPSVWWKKFLYGIIRIPLVILTFFQTQLTTKPLDNFETQLSESNFELLEQKRYLLDSLTLYRARKK